jgi:hypothetical protein
VGFDPSFRKLSIRVRYLIVLYIGAYFESRVKLLGPPLPTSHTLRILRSKIGCVHGTHHLSPKSTDPRFEEDMY